ncbi:hypothetical protein B0T26DRAFT_680001 [Lasiosphaeria miniovina]|uniref:Uncharacterized protein n=1 Tax=Lasiosphaeria miniovina TaxID=1954250 RepID=A0AA40DKA2_9PEZI|nr:uncharacterized protein B0T26DRAFT_680001 [Lasiosphaeria miniovina]KAK0706295.1 hypothetical protein B0T26DRAFT_680001 [Lasiosphaeria miniovina]
MAERLRTLQSSIKSSLDGLWLNRENVSKPPKPESAYERLISKVAGPGPALLVISACKYASHLLEDYQATSGSNEKASSQERGVATPACNTSFLSSTARKGAESPDCTRWPLQGDISASIAQQQQRINDYDCAAQIGQMGYLADFFSGVREPIPRVVFERVRRLKDAQLQLPELLFGEESQLLDSLQRVGEITRDSHQWAWAADERLISQRQGWDTLLLMLLCVIFPCDNPSKCSAKTRISETKGRETLQTVPPSFHKTIARVSLVAADLDGGKAAKKLRETVPIREFVLEYFHYRRK